MTLPLMVFTERNFVADFLQEKCIFRRKRPFFTFKSPFPSGAGGGGLGKTYAVHLRLIGKCVVDFLLVLIKRFFR